MTTAAAGRADGPIGPTEPRPPCLPLANGTEGSNVGAPPLPPAAPESREGSGSVRDGLPWPAVPSDEAVQDSTLLERVSKGDVLGALDRRSALTATMVAAGADVVELTWTGRTLVAQLLHPVRQVTVSLDSGGRLQSECGTCPDGRGLCGCAGAVLFRWIEVKQAMLGQGPGTVWRAHTVQPFFTPSDARSQLVNLTHLRDPGELMESLVFQLGLHVGVPAPTQLTENGIAVQVTTASGVIRTITISLEALPVILTALPELPAMQPVGELARLEFSSARLTPAVRAHLKRNDAIVLEAGYRLGEDRFLPLGSVEHHPEGGWLRDGRMIFRAPYPPQGLAGLFARQRTLLKGESALRFLLREHFLLRGEPWYHPQGELAGCIRPARPTLQRLEVESTDAGGIRVTPVFAAGGRELNWSELAALLQRGYGRIDGRLLLAPDLDPLIEVGLQRTDDGLAGDRLALVRITAEKTAPTRIADRDLARWVDTLLGEPGTYEAPPGLRSILRPYQQNGSAWLLRLYRTGLGALLADDMGLGKTHQTLALFCAVRAESNRSRFLVVCPRGVLDHWQRLLAEFAPDLPLVVYHGSQRTLGDLPEGGVVLTTYDVALRSVAALSARPWTVAVFDEAQRAKNPRTKGARAAKTIPAGFRLALTGTPVENRLLELWSVFDLILPGYLGSERSFRSAFRDPGGAQIERLRQRLAPFTLRRVKERVLDDLPDKLEEIRTCRLNGDQQALYAEIHAAGATTLAPQLADANADIPYMHIFALLTRLKQICDHPALVDRRFDHVSPGKLEVLDEILDEALASENRVVVFSQYVTMLNRLSRHLRGRRIDHLVLTGETRDRGAVIDRFNSGGWEPVLLASLLAGGVGIDLTGASIVVHYDRWWNPAREDQATDRVHRFGQRRFVQVFKLVTADTIEERISAIIQRKAELAREVITPTEEVLRRFTREELAELLGIPLASVPEEIPPAGPAASELSRPMS